VLLLLLLLLLSAQWSDDDEDEENDDDYPENRGAMMATIRLTSEGRSTSLTPLFTFSARAPNAAASWPDVLPLRLTSER